MLATRSDYSSSAQTIASLDKAIVTSSVLAIGCALLVGGIAVSRVTRRLHHTDTVARRISRGDLSARVPLRRSRVAAIHVTSGGRALTTCRHGRAPQRLAGGRGELSPPRDPPPHAEPPPEQGSRRGFLTSHAVSHVSHQQH
ncbi:hypothetical protein GCM10010319_24090 [Streptomyces blastmyceticus]|uniref:Uncharacterized protein n=1 Tax=Streptomyces blastmyceticus TaxID=68180 RepID=A0ABP3GIV7_9ACTN